MFNRIGSLNLVGETPASYLTSWRIRKAKKLLVTDQNNISEIATNVGYQPEAAFNRFLKENAVKRPLYTEGHSNLQSGL